MRVALARRAVSDMRNILLIVLFVQSATRKLIAKKTVRQLRLCKLEYEKAVVVQDQIRILIAKRKKREKEYKLKNLKTYSCVAIQCLLRVFIAARRTSRLRIEREEKVLLMNKSAIIIQSNIRVALAIRQRKLKFDQYVGERSLARSEATSRENTRRGNHSAFSNRSLCDRQVLRSPPWTCESDERRQ